VETKVIKAKVVKKIMSAKLRASFISQLDALPIATKEAMLNKILTRIDIAREKTETNITDDSQKEKIL
jgi:hypothetical protein